MSEWIDIGGINDIPQRGARCLETEIGRIGVFRTLDDQIYAIADQCPHRKGPLSQGIVHGASVTCPLHNWVISLETGEAQGADAGQVTTYPVMVQDGRILLSLDAISVAAE